MKTCTKCKIEKDLSEFYVSKRDGVLSNCKNCYSKTYKEYNEKKPEKAIARKKKYRLTEKAKDTERKHNHKVYYSDVENAKNRAKEYYVKNSESRRAYTKKYNETEKGRNAYYKRVYDLEYKDFLKMFDSQNGRCAICNKDESQLKRRLYVDHCHSTNKVRSLLCNNCNSVLGYSFENIEILEKVIKYINNYAN